VEYQIKEYDSLIDLLEELDVKGVYGAQRHRAVNGYISLKARYKDVPVSGTFELTPFCNLDCRMCYVHLNKNQLKEGERLLTVDEWKSIIKQAVDAGMMYATLTGGECLTYPGFKEIYLYLISLGIRPDILTNGRLLVEEMVDFFVANPPSGLQITVYGSNEDAYERFAGHRAFHEVMDGIARAQKAGLNILLTITPSKYMHKDINTLLEFIHQQGIPYTIGSGMLQPRTETGRDQEQHALETDEEISIKRIEKAYHELRQSTETVQQLPQYVPSQKKNLRGLPCGGAHSTFHVNWKGEICPCIGFSESVHQPLLGGDFVQVWKKLCNTMLAYKPPKECSECSVREYCYFCPAEKGMGKLTGTLNTRVCLKLRAYIRDKL